MNAMASSCKMPVASVLTMAIPQRTAGEGTFFVTTIAYKLSNMHGVHRKGPRHSRSPSAHPDQLLLRAGCRLGVRIGRLVMGDLRRCKGLL